MHSTIVWIDDDTYVYDELIEPLKEEYDVIYLHTAKEVLDSLDLIRSANLLIVDMIIPEGPGVLKFGHYTGLEVLETLKREYQIAMPVIVLSVVDRQNIEDVLDPLGVDIVLQKPVLGSELMDAVQQIMGHAS